MSLGVKAITVGKFYLTSDESASMMSISILLLFFPFGIESMPLPFTEGKLSLKEPSPFAIILEDFALFATSLTKWIPSATWTYNMTNNVKNDETRYFYFTMTMVNTRHSTEVSPSGLTIRNRGY